MSTIFISFLRWLTTLAQASKRSAVQKVVDGFDLVGARVLDERELVDALDVESLSIRKFAMQKDLSRARSARERALHYATKRGRNQRVPYVR